MFSEFQRFGYWWWSILVPISIFDWPGIDGALWIPHRCAAIESSLWRIELLRGCSYWWWIEIVPSVSVFAQLLMGEEKGTISVPSGHSFWYDQNDWGSGTDASPAITPSVSVISQLLMWLSESSISVWSRWFWFVVWLSHWWRMRNSSSVCLSGQILMEFVANGSYWWRWPLQRAAAQDLPKNQCS